MHLWQVARGDYGWLTPDLPIYRDYGLDDARTVASEIDGVILIQAAPSEAETHFLLDIAHRSNRFVRAVVGWTDLAAPEAPARIAALARNPMLRGLRPMLQDIADPDWILRADVTRGLDAMVQAGLSLDLLIRPIHLTRCISLATRHPGLAMVIDHGAKPDIAGGDISRWAELMATIAAHPNLACKLSGLLSECAPGDSSSDVRPYARVVIECFGPDRVIWGSDWPVLTLAATYQHWHSLATAIVRAESPAAEFAIFGGNAERFYRLQRTDR
ncbi:amidohydrolase family protein [Acidiphilium sp.]|uniref:amidohydrolase family protein n=1 Tax=Acidiphilium sp. TaxID=527 RepID=UPI003D043F50